MAVYKVLLDFLDGFFNIYIVLQVRPTVIKFYLTTFIKYKT